jgi:aminoglycoside phosphotransferase (APT) family kinase protein
MNTENSITPEQITATFRTHHLANNPSITRINTGFTNEVYVVDDYILKVCVDTNNEPNFEREIFLYQALRGLAKIPEPIVADTSKIILSKFYMIYRKIEGDPVGRRWHLLNDKQRRELIEDLCQLLRRMDNFPMGEYVHRFGLNPHVVWKEEMVNGLFQALATIREKEILSRATLQAIEKYIHETAYVLKEQKLGLEPIPIGQIACR